MLNVYQELSIDEGLARDMTYTLLRARREHCGAIGGTSSQHTKLHGCNCNVYVKQTMTGRERIPSMIEQR